MSLPQCCWRQFTLTLAEESLLRKSSISWFNARTSFCVSWSALVAAVGVWHGSLGLRELLPVLPDVESPTETVGHGHGNGRLEPGGELLIRGGGAKRTAFELARRPRTLSKLSRVRPTGDALPAFVDTEAR